MGLDSPEEVTQFYFISSIIFEIFYRAFYSNGALSMTALRE